MSQIATQQALAKLQRQAILEGRELFKRLSTDIGNMLLRSMDATGKIPSYQQGELRRSVRAEVTRYFTVNERAFADDGVTALSPYAALINRHIALAVATPVLQHHRFLKARLPQDVWLWMRNASGASYPVAEQQLDVLFRPSIEVDPQRRWVPPHKWNSPDGYQLSDRIWRVGQATRDKIDRILAMELAQGTSPVRLSQMLESYLLPERLGVTTDKPYGRNVSYDAMRLARTEISAAFNNASYVSAFMNPYVAGMDWRLSPRHPKVDICDSYATIGTGGQRLRPAYPIEDAPVPPAHPNCLCTASPAVRDDNATVIEALREKMRAGAIPPRNPSQVRELIIYLIGSKLASDIGMWIEAELLS